MARSRSTADVTMPVEPHPPAVAQNRSGSTSGPTVLAPVGVTRRSEATCSQNAPSRWWFLPWTSAAMAPPTVTLPGPRGDGTNQPCGHRGAEDRVDGGASAHRHEPRGAVDLADPPEAPPSITVPPAACAASP